MKILALEVEAEGVTPAQFAPFAEAEARRVWELYQNGIIREIYFRADRSEAVLILECADTNEAQHVLESLPLVKAELIRFELIPLAPYPGFARLFNL
jgi:muconolactone delta-isomerase